MSTSPTSIPSSDAALAPSLPLAKLSIEQYDRMIDVGVFESEAGQSCTGRQRIELIEGVMIQMNPIGHEHENVVDWLARWSFENTLASEVRVRIQESIALPCQSSVLEPDIAWVRSATYHSHRPSAEDVLLIIEVAKSSAKVDLGEKGVLYATAGIADYWVANIETKSLVVHRNPVDGRYTRIVSHDGKNSVQTLAKPKVVLDVKALYSILFFDSLRYGCT